MELMLSCKRSDVGMIPEDWTCEPLSQFFSFISYGFTNPMPTVHDGIFMITAADINDGRLQLETARKTSETAYRTLLSAKSRPRPNDILLTKDGTLGRLALVGDEIICINQSVAVIRPNDRVEPLFLKLLLESPRYQKRMVEDAGGSTIKHIYITIVDKMPLGLPLDRAEQRAIAQALSDVDALIATLDQMITKKRDLKQAAMQQLLTGKTRLPGFSGEWEVQKMPDVCWFQEGPGVRNTQFTTSGVKLLNGTNIFRGRINLDTTERFISEHEANGPYAHFLADAGDIVIACSGISVEKFHEKVAAVSAEHLQFCMNTSTMRFKPRLTSLVRGYLCHFLMSDIFKRQIAPQATGSAQLNFGPSHVSKVVLLLPALSEQTAIAAVLSDMDAELSVLEARRDKTRNIKQAMMQELLTGKTRLV